MYRSRGGGVAAAKPHRRKHRRGPDCRQIEVCAAYGDGKCVFAEVVSEYRNWCAEEYEEIVMGPLVDGLLSRANKPYELIRDNDPNGFATKRGMEAEASLPTKVTPLPKRRPNLMPLDYSIHNEIDRRMSDQERQFHHDYEESRDTYMARLLDTYRTLPEDYIRKTCGSMKARLQAVINAGGGHTKKN
jgi:hypothetical protein